MDRPVQRKVTLSKADRETAAGLELIGLLTELSADGQVTCDEVNRLRAWLEVHRGVYFPACSFLYELVETIPADGEISEEELDRIALAIERVLPKDVRVAATLKRKEHRAARRNQQLAARAEAQAKSRAAKIEARERARPLHRADFMVAGARRSAERREACEGVCEGENVTLEREPENVHDTNAILVLTCDGSELGYVPREYARQMAPLLDAGAAADAIIKKLLCNTEDGHVIPVVVSTLSRAGTHSSGSEPVSHSHQSPEQRKKAISLPHIRPNHKSATRALPLIAIVVLLALVMAGYCAS